MLSPDRGGGSGKNPSGSGDAPSGESMLSRLLRLKGMDEKRAKTLMDAGFDTMEKIGKASVEEVEKLDGFDRKLAETVVNALSSASSSGDSGDNGSEAESGGGEDDKTELEKWLAGEEEGALEEWLKGEEEKKGGKKIRTKKEETGKREPGDGRNGQNGVDSLKRWLMGDEDTALEEWLTEEPEEEPGGSEAVRMVSADISAIREEVKSLVKGLKAGKVNIEDVVSENATLKASLEEEIRKREELEKELENVKKSSVAVIKYIKAQQAKAQGKDALKLQRMLDQQIALKEKLEVKLKETENELQALRREMEKKLESMPEAEKEIKKKEMELIQKEKELAVKEKNLLQKEEALASGEAILLQEAGEPLSEEALAAAEAEWLEEKKKLLDEKAELEKRVQVLELELSQLKEQMELSGKDEAAISEELLLKERELANKEKALLLKEEEFADLKRQLSLKEEEIRKLRETVAYKEEELLRREEDLMHREKLLEAERRRVEEAKKGIGTMEQQEAQKKLEELKAQIAEKEREIMAKEKYIRAKEEELRLREQGLIEEEIEAREEDRMMEWKIEKVKTGIQRLDDLLMGGIPFGSNVAVYGPAFVGKETLMNRFIAEGLKKGVPAIWVITDKTPLEIREEMSFVLSGYEEYEKMGLVRYVDTYSLTMGEEPTDPYTTYIDGVSDTKEILTAVDDAAKEFKKTHKYYRLAFRSVSTVIAYLGATETFKFLQPFTGRRKRDKAVALYAIEKGMHSETEIQSISHVMDGTIDFKVEQLKTYLAVQGICDVQSRSYIQYTHSKQNLNIGSFTLDHIR
ncbi:MAG: hypothetical protein J7L61_04620 [Thermoplasmata archaeon]|nr:hypothetical protein [Thermoplasmata archaeon]